MICLLEYSVKCKTNPNPRDYPPTQGMDHGVHHVPEVLEITCHQFPVKNWVAMLYNMKKLFHQLLDGLHLVLVVDVHERVGK